VTHDQAALAARARATADADEGPRDRLSGVVAIVIAFTTLVAAICGFLQADTAQRAGDRRGEAEQLALQALASAQSSRETAQVELETFHRWVEQRTEAGNALLASLYASSDPVRHNELLMEQQRWETIAAATLKQSAIDPQSEFGPENDPTFPQRYFAAATEESTRLNALQDAANEEASKLDERAAGYTAILAMLAVALYLFGLTLAVTGRWRRLGFLGVGVGMLAVALLWLGQTALVPPFETNDEAATEYAAARVASATAFDATGYQAAQAHYTRAIELRPSFARAYAERASVIFLGSSPQRSGFVSIAPPEALARAAADLRSALSLGLENAPTLGSLGFDLFAEGVQSADVNLLDQSIGYTRRAIALDPGQPLYRYNLGVALAAAGRFEEARNAYQEAVLATIYIDPSRQTLRQEPFIEESWVAGALTDLEIVWRHKDALTRATAAQGYDEQIILFKQQIVGRVVAESPNAPVDSPATVADFELQIFPAELQWEGTVNNYDPQRDTISAQWYHDDPQGNGWAVIPEVSLAEPPGVQADGRLFQLTPYTARIRPAACLPPGAYRVELFVNGRLAGQATATADFSEFDAFLARDLTAAFCRPADWVRRDDRLPGLIDGFQSSDGTYGAYIARYSLPGSLREVDDISAQIEDVTVESFSDWFPATPVYQELSGTTAEYFMGLDRAAWRWYDYGSGYVRVGAGVTGDGAVLVGMVYGPYAWFDGAEPYQIVNSMIEVN
jgi:tetratricopeptide (TPR) repeat protein